jgi:hypothetical protein
MLSIKSGARGLFSKKKRRDLEEAVGSASLTNLVDDKLLVRRGEVYERDVVVRRHFGEPWPIGLGPDIALRQCLSTPNGGQKLIRHEEPETTTYTESGKLRCTKLRSRDMA